MKTPENNQNKGLYAVKQCPDCKAWLDEKSKVIAEAIVVRISREELLDLMADKRCEPCRETATKKTEELIK
jgi:hypothetical protein